ncbi:GNAT family N-acetyltransferase [Aquamicrobium zhengzhouense]|uniref:GNAT family N-acetyltransferase n=1 Tax=Aquamicrobium zhengzhouense TaxID=2781738 RepID=A0ABS0SDV5_9HYPH|nr:GNAT family N-acetyltransferase [Aquamicrobium zhengzhouense]MBI1620657.1 GNAT family N-acetyltransferase [Aquamicrobium zhengzhouense]
MTNEFGERAGPLLARITHLEMLSPPAHRVQMPMGPRLAVFRVRDMPPSFYRYLYREIGKAHHWMLRREDPDEHLSDIINAETAEIHVLYVDGCPAGFFELDFSSLPSQTEIIYFGLTPHYQGRGLSKFFLSEAIFAAWSHNPERLVIHTNTLDSPRALQLYQRMGFIPFAWSQEEVEPWL